MNRNLWIKGTLRRDWLDFNIPGNSYRLDRRDARRAGAELIASVIGDSAGLDSLSAAIRIFPLLVDGAVIPGRYFALRHASACPATPCDKLSIGHLLNVRRVLLDRGAKQPTLRVLTEGRFNGNNKPAHRTRLSRTLAAIILVGLYCFSIIGVSTLLVGASSTAAFARRRRTWRWSRRRWTRFRSRRRRLWFVAAVAATAVVMAAVMAAVMAMAAVTTTPGCYWAGGIDLSVMRFDH